ncbi:MAG: hypothetical protein ITD38_01975, partial [Nitrosospira sp.]|nr:hypothetical protein [Nitrosospira sp.]
GAGPGAFGAHFGWRPQRGCSFCCWANPDGGAFQHAVGADWYAGRAGHSGQCAG